MPVDCMLTKAKCLPRIVRGLNGAFIVFRGLKETYLRDHNGKSKGKECSLIRAFNITHSCLGTA